MSNSRLVKSIISFIIVTTIFFFLGRYIYTNWVEIKSFEWNIDYLILILSLFSLCIPFIMMAFGWYIILRILNSITNPLQCIRIYTVSQLARYIPGKIFMFVGRVMLAERMGVKKSISILSVFFEAIISTSGAFFAILILYIFSSKIQIDWLDPLRIGFLIVCGLFMLNPRLIKFILNKIYQMRYGRDVDFPSIDFKYYKIVLLCFYYIIIWVLVGMSFYFLVSSFFGQLISLKVAFDISCIFLISWLVGFLSFLTPGGIGVREAIMTIGLEQLFPLYLVAIIAIISRIWFTIGELSVVIIVYLIPKRAADILSSNTPRSFTPIK